jgi:hypothetical protein
VAAPAPLHQGGSIERVAAVFALAAAREQLVCGKPLVDNFRVGPHRPNGIDCDVVFVVIEQGLFSIYLSSYVSFVYFDSYVSRVSSVRGGKE